MLDYNKLKEIHRSNKENIENHFDDEKNLLKKVEKDLKVTRKFIDKVEKCACKDKGPLHVLKCLDNAEKSEENKILRNNSCSDFKKSGQTTHARPSTANKNKDKLKQKADT